MTDLGRIQLKNIAEPIRAYALRVGVPAQAKPTLALPDKPSIAVLPFQNMSGDAEQEYFVDGMLEDIITGLSSIKWLFVIARNSSFIYKGKPVDIRQFGRELGVRYVLEGGLRKAGSRIRITGQLIEAETGAHLWADKFDGPLDNIFDLQDQITDRVVGILEPNLTRSEIERSRRKHPENLDAYDLYLRALPHVTLLTTEGANSGARFLDDALALDPNYAAAHALCAWRHEILFLHAGCHEAERTAAVWHARIAVESKTDDAAALALAAHTIALLGKESEAAVSTIERALSLNGSCATAHFWGAHVHAFSGNSSTAIALAERALRLSPFDPLAYVAYQSLGMAALQDARFDEAALQYAKAAHANPGSSSYWFAHGIALALAGRAAEAGPSLQRGRELEPEWRFGFFFQIGITRSLAEKFAEGARLLGLPE